MIKIKKLFIVVICLLAVALSAISCAYNDEREPGNIGSESETSHYKKITLLPQTSKDKKYTFSDADDYKSKMAEYIAKYENNENLHYFIAIDFTSEYDVSELNVIEYVRKDNAENYIKFTVEPGKFNPELLASICEDDDVISMRIWVTYGVQIPD